MARRPQGAAVERRAPPADARAVSPAGGGPSSRARRFFLTPQPSRSRSRVHAGCARLPATLTPSRRRPRSSPPRHACAATWTAPARVSVPHTFVSQLDAAWTGDGTAVAELALPGRGRCGARRRAWRLAEALRDGHRDRSARCAAATTELMPYARGRHRRARAGAKLDRPRRPQPPADRVRIRRAARSLGTARTVTTDAVAFVPPPRRRIRTTRALVARIVRIMGNRRVVKVSLRTPGGQFGAPSIIACTSLREQHRGRGRRSR